MDGARSAALWRLSSLHTVTRMRGLIGQDRSALLALLSIFLAMMSVGAAFYQNYIYTRQLEAIQRNVSRGEYIRTCKEVIDAYFQVKLKVGVIARAGERERAINISMADTMMELDAATLRHRRQGLDAVDLQIGLAVAGNDHAAEQV